MCAKFNANTKKLNLIKHPIKLLHNNFPEFSLLNCGKWRNFSFRNPISFIKRLIRREIWSQVHGIYAILVNLTIILRYRRRFTQSIQFDVTNRFSVFFSFLFQLPLMRANAIFHRHFSVECYLPEKNINIWVKQLIVLLHRVCAVERESIVRQAALQNRLTFDVAWWRRYCKHWAHRVISV